MKPWLFSLLLALAPAQLYSYPNPIRSVPLRGFAPSCEPARLSSCPNPLPASEQIIRWPLREPTILSKLSFQLALTAPGASSGLEWIPDDTPVSVFGGTDQTIRVVFHNPADHLIETGYKTRLFQAGAATAMPLGPAQAWKTVRALPGQTCVETATLPFPEVKTATLVLVRWLDDSGAALGPAKVWVYPTNLLHDLKALSPDNPVGLLDPRALLKPLLRRSGVDYQDLELTPLESFSGNLVLVGPFNSASPAPAGLAKRLKRAASRGLAVVWFTSPPAEKANEAEFPATLLREGDGAIVLCPAKLLSKIPDNPVAQRELIRLASLVVNPEKYETELLEPTP